MRRLPALLLALLFTLPPSAIAAPPRAGFLQLYDAYQRSGVIAGCSYREADLRAALKEMPADVEAYDPGFADALNAALEQHAAGCEEGISTAPAAATGVIVAADGSPGPAIDPKRTADTAADAEASIPIPLIALAAVVALAALAGAALALRSRPDGAQRWGLRRP
jgi:hypothetical protein